MFDLGIFTIPVLSLLAVFGFAVLTDSNMIAFDINAVPQIARDMGFDEMNVRNNIMYRIYTISQVASTSRAVTYSTVNDMQNQALLNISESLGIERGVMAVQEFLGLIPYRLKGQMVQEGDTISLLINGFSSDNIHFNFALKTDTKVFDSTQMIKGYNGLLGSITGSSENTKLNIIHTDTEIKSLLDKAAEAIVDRIDPYLLARYYFMLERPQATFTKTIPQIARCLAVLPEKYQMWPVLLWGRVYHRKGEYEKAIAVYEKNEQIDPYFAFTKVRWGEALAALGKHQEAILKYEQAINHSYFYPAARSEAYSLWAESLIAMNQIDQAEEMLYKGVNAFNFGNERSLANGIIHNALGRFLMKYRNDYVEAEYHLRKAIYLDNKPDYYADLQEVIAKRIPGYDTYLANLRHEQVSR